MAASSCRSKEATSKGHHQVRFLTRYPSYLTISFSLPLPEAIPLVFKVQPEYMFDDIVEFWDFVMKYNPTVLESSGQKELIDFAMTFLTSTWYITNPYLKSKIVAVLAIGVRPFRRLNNGVLGNALCQHQLSLDHLMTCLMSFYVGE